MSRLKKLLGSFFVLLLPIILLTSITYAQKADKLSLKTEGYLITVVVDEKTGEKKEVAKPLPKKVYPGDVIEYRIVATNTSDGDLKNIFIKVPVPKGTVYVAGSATGEPEFSIDGGKTFSKVPKYTVVENGKKVEKVAPPEMYTFVRWKIDRLAPGESREFRYRVMIPRPENQSAKQTTQNKGETR